MSPQLLPELPVTTSNAFLHEHQGKPAWSGPRERNCQSFGPRQRHRLFKYVSNIELDLLCNRVDVGEVNTEYYFSDDEDGKGSCNFDAWLSDSDDASPSI